MSSTIASSSSSISATAAAATSSSATKTLSAGSNLKVVGIILAVCSGVLIGSSFVFKKKGLLRSQAGGVAGEGVAYLKSEKLTFFGWLGCGLCIIGSVIIALNGPTEDSVGEIRQFQKLFLAPGFLVWGSVLIATSIVIVVFFAPRYGTKSMLWYIMVCSMIGGISVSVTSGLGAAIVQSALGDNQASIRYLSKPSTAELVTLITEVYYLNKALALFNTAMVTPTYYVIFTFFSMVTTIVGSNEISVKTGLILAAQVLFQGLKSSVSGILTLVMGFLVICVGIVILQMSKVDPVQLSRLDRRSTILLQAARSNTEAIEEKDALGVEDPGMDALRGSFGTFGSIIRARSARRMSQSSSVHHIRPVGSNAPYVRDSAPRPWSHSSFNPPHLDDHPSGLQRHQLYDAPMPSGDIHSTSSVHGSPLMGKRPTIKFDSQDVVHQYDRPGTGDAHVTEHRRAVGTPVQSGYPPLPPLPYSNSKTDGLPPPPTSTSNLLGGIEGDLSFDDTSSVGASAGGSTKAGSSSGSTIPSESTVRQTLSINPTRFAHDKEIQSAPPSANPQAGYAVSRMNVGRGSSKDLFDSHVSSAGTLLSFPSVTDSARSEPWEEESASASAKKGSDRGKSSAHKRYPKGDGDDDREESMSLWQRRRDGEDDDDGPFSAESAGAGSIRLITPGPRF
ncbi:hypothetical protein H0H92_005438 [Tricholoma furcatifolium]|nr:hypothetical protein H0H92_005438 [Tricholoma furcatifolium]